MKYVFHKNARDHSVHSSVEQKKCQPVPLILSMLLDKYQDNSEVFFITIYRFHQFEHERPYQVYRSELISAYIYNIQRTRNPSRSMMTSKKCHAITIQHRWRVLFLNTNRFVCQQLVSGSIFLFTLYALTDIIYRFYVCFLYLPVNTSFIQASPHGENKKNQFSNVYFAASV